MFIKILTVLIMSVSLLTVPNTGFSKEASDPNYKSTDHNYFGQEPRLLDLRNIMINDQPNSSTDTGAWIGDLSSYSAEELIKKAKTYQKGTYHQLKSLSAERVTNVSIQSELCGIVIEPSKTNNFEISYWGEESHNYPFSAEILADGTLKISAKGNSTKAHYINTSAEKRINTFVIQVPAKTYQSFVLNEGIGAALISEIATPINATNKKGSIEIVGETLSSAYTMQNEQGWLSMKATTITGPVKMTCTQGWIDLEADTITGVADLAATQGWVTVDTKTLGRANLRAVQGWVTVSADQISDDVVIAAKSGWATMVLGKNQTDLNLTVKSAFDEVINFPAGWKTLSKNTYAIGSGKPHVAISGDWVELSFK